MKKNLVKKSIGLIVSMAMMAGLMFAYAPVEAKAEVHAEPQAGDTVKLQDYDTTRTIGTDIELDYVIISKDGSDWDKDLKIYVVWDVERHGGYQPGYGTLQWYDGYWQSTPSPDGISKDGVISMVNDGKTSSYTKSSVNGSADSGYAYYWVDSPAAPETSASSSPVHVHTWSWEVITEATETSDGLEGYVCSCGATRNTVKTPAAGVVMAKNLNKVTNAKDGETVVLELGMNHSLPRAFMEKIAEKRNTTFVIHSTYEHKNYEVVIPAGTPVVLDPKDEWFGILKQIEMFGMTEIQ